MKHASLFRPLLLAAAIAVAVQPAFGQSITGSSAVSSATRASTDAAARAATRAATDAAVRSSGRAAADAAVRSANRASTDAAVRAANRVAVDTAVRSATRASTEAATRAAADAAVRSTNRTASDIALRSAGRGSFATGLRTRDAASAESRDTLSGISALLRSRTRTAVDATSQGQAALSARGEIRTEAQIRADEASARAHAAFQQRLAQIDRIRDRAVETGNTVLLESADRMEASVRADFQAHLRARTGQTESVQTGASASAGANSRRETQGRNGSFNARQNSETTGRFDVLFPRTDADTQSSLRNQSRISSRTRQNDRADLRSRASSRFDAAGRVDSSLRGRLNGGEESRQRGIEFLSRSASESQFESSTGRVDRTDASIRSQQNSTARVSP